MGKLLRLQLTYHIMSNAGLNVAVAGNIGESFAKLVADNKHDYYVLELSSFQLDGMFNFKANIAMLLNITPDHLDRYDNDMQKYVESKLRIIQNQTEEMIIYNADDEVIVKELQKRKYKARIFLFQCGKVSRRSLYSKRTTKHKYKQQTNNYEYTRTSTTG